MSGAADPARQLAQALAFHRAWQDEGRPGGAEGLLAAHPAHRELLEMLLEEDDTEPAAEAAHARVLGDFELGREIGRGGMGVVYEAVQRSVGRKVALKVLAPQLASHPAALGRLADEARTIGRLDHPGIVKVHAFQAEEGLACLAMELVDGSPLDEVIEQDRAEGPPSPARCREIAAAIAEVAEALDHAHGRGIVHRDVKPSNILVAAAPDGRLRLTDFGIARRLDEPSLTATGELRGTPYYVSPEQVTGGRVELDQRTDIYSLGATLYEWLTRTRPFPGETTAEVFGRILNRDPDPPRNRVPGLSADLAAVVERALEKDPDRRYLTARAFADDLRRFVQGEPVHARPVTRLTRAIRWSRRRPLVSGALATAALSLVGGLLVSVVAWQDADASYRQYARLADVSVAEDLLAAARDRLWPVESRQIGPLRAWIEDAAALVGTLPDRSEELDALRARARPTPPAGEDSRLGVLPPQATDLPLRWLLDARARERFLRAELRDPQAPEAARNRIRESLADVERSLAGLEAAADTVGPWTFDDPELQFRHDSLQALCAALLQLQDQALPDVRARLAWADQVRNRTLERPEQLWDAAMQRVGADPRFRDLALRPIEGFVPLGPDPETGLEEFAIPRTGPLPVRGEDGRLELTEDSALVLVLVPEGEPLLGAQRLDADAPHHDRMASYPEGPVRRVTLGPLLVGKYEVTQQQWLSVMDSNPSQWARGFRDRKPDGTVVIDGRHPVESLTWHEAVEFCRRLGLRLPDENEWEYAARAGSDAPWYTGRDPAGLAGHANLRDEGSRRSFSPGTQVEMGLSDGHSTHAPVGTYRPNGFGLHDVLGNVGEWVDLVLGTRTEGPHHAMTPRHQVQRGGGALYLAANARVTARIFAPPGKRSESVGFRVVRDLPRASHSQR